MKTKAYIGAALLAAVTTQAIPTLNIEVSIVPPEPPTIWPIYNRVEFTLSGLDPETTMVGYSFDAPPPAIGNPVTTQPFSFAFESGSPGCCGLTPGEHTIYASIFVNGVYTETLSGDFTLPRVPDAGSTTGLLGIALGAVGLLRRHFTV